MQRYFVSPSAIGEHEVVITGDDVHHLTRVMRLGVGDRVRCSDGSGVTVEVVLRSFGSHEVVGDIVSRIEGHSESRIDLTLYQGLPKGDKMDWIVQKGTEVGIRLFRPVVMERTVVEYTGMKEERKRERWQRIAKEAAEQSGRDIVPDVARVLSLKDASDSMKQHDLLLVPYEGETAHSLRSVLTDHPNANRIAIVIGPEGGIASDELTRLQLIGAIPVTLGPRILRTETAGLVTAAAILYACGELGG